MCIKVENDTNSTLFDDEKNDKTFYENDQN